MSVQLCFIQTAALGMLFFLSKQIVCIDSKASGSSLCFGALAHVLLTKTPPGCPAARCHVRSGKFSRFACFLTCFHQSGASAAETSFLLVYTPSFLPHYSSFYWADFVMNGSALEVLLTFNSVLLSYCIFNEKFLCFQWIKNISGFPWMPIFHQSKAVFFPLPRIKFLRGKLDPSIPFFLLGIVLH